MFALVFLCVHLLYSASSEGTLTPGHCRTSATSAQVWMHHVVLVQSCWWGEGSHTQRLQARGGLQNPSLPFHVSTTSCPARAGYHTWKGLTEDSPAHPHSPNSEALAVLLLDEIAQSMGLELALPALPALLCRLALGHKKSQDQLVWKYMTNLFQEKHERTEEKLPFSKFITQQNLGEFLWKKENAFP